MCVYIYIYICVYIYIYTYIISYHSYGFYCTKTDTVSCGLSISSWLQKNSNFQHWSTHPVGFPRPVACIFISLWYSINLCWIPIHPLENWHRPWKEHLSSGNSSSDSYLPGSMIIYWMVEEEYILFLIPYLWSSVMSINYLLCPYICHYKWTFIYYVYT